MSTDRTRLVGPLLSWISSTAALCTELPCGCGPEKADKTVRNGVRTIFRFVSYSLMMLLLLKGLVKDFN